MTLVFLLILLLPLRSVRDWEARFLVVALWLRYVMSAYSKITYQHVLPGISINALGSIAVIGIAFLLIDKNHLRRRIFLPVYAMIAICIASGFANDSFSEAIDSILKWMYFLAITILALDVFSKLGTPATVRLLLPAFLPPIGFQLATIALGLAKAAEADGSASYIGGYNHEAAFSVGLLALVFIAAIYRARGAPIGFASMASGVFGIIMANYRTALLAAVPLVAIYVIQNIISRFVQHQKHLVLVAMIPLMILAFGLVGTIYASRFADLSTVFTDSASLIKPPEDYTVAETRILSGRPYIWSHYINGYVNGDIINRFIGLGPGTWEDVFPRYAHNTIVSLLYELGLLGVGVILWIWLVFLRLAFRVRGRDRVILLASHASFIVLNMSTMPFWLIEGNIVYALICGYTIALAEPSTRSVKRNVRPTRYSPVAFQSSLGTRRI